MTERDRYVGGHIERLDTPSDTEAFFAEFQRRAAAHDRLVARRWRLAAIAFAVIAAAAVCSAGVLAASPDAARTVDLSVQCRTMASGGLPVFSLATNATGPPQPDNKVFPEGWPALLEAFTGGESNPWAFFVASPTTSGYNLDRRRCSATTQRPPLKSAGLPALMPLHKADRTMLRLRCVDVARVVLRVRLDADGQGLPRHAVLAASTPKGKRLVFVDWTPDLVRAFAARACDS